MESAGPGCGQSRKANPIGDLPGRAGESQMLLAPQHQRIDNALHWLEQQPNRHFISCFDPRYPALLKQIKQPPLALFVEGSPEVLAKPNLAIVGSREPTPTGRQVAFDFLQLAFDFSADIRSLKTICNVAPNR